MATDIRPASRPRSSRPTTPDIPPLENGDHLARPEFERRYDAMPHLKKAELIEGVVYMGSPVSHTHHGRPHYSIIVWMGTYSAATPGTEGSDNGSVRLDLDNMPQPDAFLMIRPDHGGRPCISEDDYIEGPPELIVEVASSSASYDLHQKMRVYRRHGVREYVVWRTRDSAIDWFVLREGRYETLAKSPEGHYQSEVFPGLWLDPEALIRGDLTGVIAFVQRGIASPEHAAFVDRLKEEAARRAPTQGEPQP